MNTDEQCEHLRIENARLMSALELAWGIIANGRAFDPAMHDKWEAAKFKFRDEHWHPALDRNVATRMFGRPAEEGV